MRRFQPAHFPAATVSLTLRKSPLAQGMSVSRPGRRWTCFEDAIRQQLRLVPTMPATVIALSFPPIQLPVGFGQVRKPAQRTVLTMVTGYSRGLSTILIPTRRAEDLFTIWWRLIPPVGGRAPDAGLRRGGRRRAR